MQVRIAGRVSVEEYSSFSFSATCRYFFPEAGSDDINSRAFIERGASWRVRASAAGLRRRVCVSSPSIGDEDPPATLTRSAWGRGIASSLNFQLLLTLRAQP